MTTPYYRLSVIRRLRALFASPKGGVDIASLATRHLFRGHKGEALLCRECVEDS